MEINLYHQQTIRAARYIPYGCNEAFYSADTERQLVREGVAVPRPGKTEATTITLPLTELELEHYLENMERLAQVPTYVDGVMDAIRIDITPYVTWIDKDHIDKEATMKRLQTTWAAGYKFHVATRQKYIERAKAELRKEFSNEQRDIEELREEFSRVSNQQKEQIAALQRIQTHLLYQQNQFQEQQTELTTNLQMELVELKDRLTTLELKAALDRIPPPISRKTSSRDFLLIGFVLVIGVLLCMSPPSVEKRNQLLLE